MRWKILLIIFVVVVTSGVAVRRFPAVFWAGEKEATLAPTAEISPVMVPEGKRLVIPAESIQGGETAVREKAPESSFIADVPFTVQAPFGEWDDPIFQNGCEEAALVMAAHWLTGQPLTQDIAKKEIRAIAQFEQKTLGQSIDASVADTEKIFRGYYGATTSEVRADITLDDMRETLATGALVIVPADGRKLQNPNYKQPGPTTHMLVVIGYDAEKKEFITNDSGTRKGQGYRYPESILFTAIRDYPTGDHLLIRGTQKDMIIVRK
ncbi:MAG: C39 family peptidase [Candidatus Moraniibacteriota bacterium]